MYHASGLRTTTEPMHHTEVARIPFATTHPFFKHFKIISFPDRAPSLPKHHRHRRHLQIHTLGETSATTSMQAKNERQQRDANMLNKLNLIHFLLQRSEPQVGRDKTNTTSNQTAHQLLDRVMHELAAIQTGPVLKNDSGCNINGNWLSESAGGLFSLTSSGQDEPIAHQKAYDKAHVGFMIHKEWNITLTFPYSNNTEYLMVTGVNVRDKLSAVFMGQCRICRKRELLQGHWLITSHSRDCESVGSTAKLISDVWRRDNVEALSNHFQSVKRKKGKGVQKEVRRQFHILPHHNTNATSNGNNTGGAGPITFPSETTKGNWNEAGSHKLHIKLH